VKARLTVLINLITYLSFLPFILFILTTTLLACGLAFVKLNAHVSNLVSQPAVRPTYRLAILPTERPESADPAARNSEQEVWPTPSPTTESAIAATVAVQKLQPSPTQTAWPAVTPAQANLDPPPTIASSDGNLPSAIPAASEEDPTPSPTLLATVTPLPPKPALPTATPSPTLTPKPSYDFLLAEFYNSPTTNSFLMVYVAVVDPKEIPIGDMKVIATRLDHNLTYESPLTKWHYEGYSAPGEVIKSGNTKFEPPGGIQSTAWVLHLEDVHGNRQSDDIYFDTDANSKQWYFIKFRRMY